jgi:SAM-dependent MidA family methyltransferase
MLGRQFREMWDSLDRPSPFDLVEVGAGNGALARDILSWARRTAPVMFEAARYTIVEISEPLVARQRSRLDAEGLTEAVSWSPDLPSAVTGVIFSNELLDAMPIHRVAVESGRLREVYVTHDGTDFGEKLRDPSPEIVAYFEHLGLLPGEGCRAEVNLEAPAWVRAAAKSLDRGYLQTIDYGYEAEELYAPWRTDGTLLCFYRHNPSTDPYARIGRQDMTTHVDFTTLRRAGEEPGLRTLGLVTQSEFLAKLGIGEAMRPPESGEMEEYFARRRAVTELLDPGGLGRIRVLIQAKGVGDLRLTGLGSQIASYDGKRG